MTSVGVVAHGGKELGGGLPELRKTLASYGIGDPPWREVPKSKYVPEHVGDLIDEGIDLLFVWGGDGTVQRVIDAVAGRPVTLAILPAGTANLLATNLGLPRDLAECVRIGLHGGRRTLDVGKVNGERFAVMTGVGLDADDDPGRRCRTEGQGGTSRVRMDRREERPMDAVEMTIEVDGKTWFRDKASCVLVGNVGDVFGGLSVFPEATPDDGRLDIGVVTADGWWQWTRTLGRSVIGDVDGSPFVQTTTGRSIDVRLNHRLPYELDGGDRKATKKLKIKVKPEAVTIAVPDEERR